MCTSGPGHPGHGPVCGRWRPRAPAGRHRHERGSSPVPPRFLIDHTDKPAKTQKSLLRPIGTDLRIRSAGARRRSLAAPSPRICGSRPGGRGRGPHPCATFPPGAPAGSARQSRGGRRGAGTGSTAESRGRKAEGRPEQQAGRQKGEPTRKEFHNRGEWPGKPGMIACDVRHHPSGCGTSDQPNARRPHSNTGSRTRRGENPRPQHPFRRITPLSARTSSPKHHRGRTYSCILRAAASGNGAPGGAGARARGRVRTPATGTSRGRPRSNTSFAQGSHEGIELGQGPRKETVFSEPGPVMPQCNGGWQVDPKTGG